MPDFLFLLATLGLFALGAGLVRVCERI